MDAAAGESSMTNWKKVWEDFDKWMERKPIRCSKCKRMEFFDPEWEDQQKTIMRLVKKHSMETK